MKRINDLNETRTDLNPRNRLRVTDHASRITGYGF
jgi:hypothetical protein